MIKIHQNPSKSIKIPSIAPNDFTRGEGLAEALSGGLLKKQGVVATNFLPHVDLAEGPRIPGDPAMGPKNLENHGKTIGKCWLLMANDGE